MKTKFYCHGLISPYAKFYKIRQREQKNESEKLAGGGKEKKPTHPIVFFL